MKKWAYFAVFACFASQAGGRVLAQGLPDAPQAKVIDREFAAVYGALAGTKAWDMWRTSEGVSRGCWETNPIFGGHSPSDRRLALTAAGYFVGEVALGYAVKRIGRKHWWTRPLWLLEPGYQTQQHIRFALSAPQNCRR